MNPEAVRRGFQPASSKPPAAPAGAAPLAAHRRAEARLADDIDRQIRRRRIPPYD